ncbi:HWE histidine kinase domain-containing protein [Niveispirillum sp. BGYR6]|uniref:HWE histidine kinase domain-containing protein n=1 Tax=Niveispirillum sp. BGYR6 TaxID=2971249 RepID=UPI0022B972DD|nr:HWE histidine kinase domain-containing protein [Niveispirillum sp. BGYR6]MDG5493824.1 HWE histidine kinase domain-containing protein [Niveispirillum sp. BGYR6]
MSLSHPALRPGAAETVHILHVEDSPADAELVRERITETGLTVEIKRVMTRAAFIQALDEGGVDLILSDYALPSFDGNAALALARQSVPDVPFIFVSGVLGEEVAVESLQSGAVDFVGKQRLQRLPAAILRALTEARRRQQHRETEEALKASEARLRFVLTASNLGSWELDVESSRVVISDVCARHLGLGNGGQAPETVSRAAVRATIHPDDLPHVVQSVATALENGTELAVECRIPRPDGSLCWLQLRGRGTYDALGRPLRMAGITLDTTERRAAEERQALLMQEVDHRAKNMLAVVLAMVRLTPMTSRDSFVQTIEGRIAALARAHTLLARSRWEGAELGQLVREEMAPYASHVSIQGPQLLLVPEAAQAFAMVLHELATNAAKHGALSLPEGRLSIDWGFTDQGRQLTLEWRESDGPPVTPPERRGFGTLVIRQNMEHQLAGKAEIDWQPDGLQVRMRVPTAAVVRRRGPGDGA